MQNLSLLEVCKVLEGYLSGQIVPTDKHEADTVKKICSILPDIDQFVHELAICENTSCPLAVRARNLYARIKQLP